MAAATTTISTARCNMKALNSVFGRTTPREYACFQQHRRPRIGLLSLPIPLPTTTTTTARHAFSTTARRFALSVKHKINDTSSWVVADANDPSKPYKPDPAYPAPPPGLKQTVRAVSPVPETVEGFIRTFPHFTPTGLHAIPRDVVAATPLRKDLITMAVVWQNNNARQGTHKEKDRAEVSGSNKKARPQKGTGRARVGDKRPPHWRGGGRAHALRPKDYSTELPLAVKRLAMRAALTAKFLQNQLTVVHSLREPKPAQEALDTDYAEIDESLFSEEDRKANYEANKERLRLHLERILETNSYKNFTELRRPEDGESQYKHHINDKPAHHLEPPKYHSVLMCIARDPNEEWETIQQERQGNFDPEAPLGSALDSYWNLYEAAHHSERVEVVPVQELDVLRIMKYRNLIIEKEALDLLIERLI